MKTPGSLPTGILGGAVAALLLAAAGAPAADDFDEFRVKPQQVFEFAENPTVSRDGDKVTITFTSRGYCDVTVAIEETSGSAEATRPGGFSDPGVQPRIIRHLASGVLGATAPEPFEKNSLAQALVWDGKDDQGAYVDNTRNCSVRVSLGLRPRFERTLLWSPHRQRSGLPILAAAPEGVYVFDAVGVDYLRLFDHNGDYVRTVYPFPADKLKDVVGLNWHDFPQGARWPIKESGYQQTLLTSGDNDSIHDKNGARHGGAAAGMAVRGKRLALAYEHLNRLATDGTSGSLPLKGPETGFKIQMGGYGGYGEGEGIIGPSSLAFSPDGATLYMTGYLWRQRSGHSGCYHVVKVVDFAKGEKATVFAGSTALGEFGRDERRFAVPTSVACDSAGRVYVSDFLNDRVQVFDAGGRLLKSVPVEKPAKVMVHRKTGEVFVCSWAPIGIPGDAWRAYDYDPDSVKNTLAQFSPYPECRRMSLVDFPLGRAGQSNVFQAGQLHHVELDSWADGPDPTFWVVSRKFIASRADHRLLYIDQRKVMAEDVWSQGVRVIRHREGEWETLTSFGERAVKAVQRVRPIAHNIQELYVNPTTGRLYVGEADSGATVKAFNELIEADPATGKVRFVRLPFNALDIAFDLKGLIYLRSTDVVARYDPVTWREVPWDYGEELATVTSGMGGNSAPAVSGIVMPTVSPVCFHQGGMSVSPTGNLAVACSNRPKGLEVHHDFEIFGKATQYGKPYRPKMYPGREESSTSCCVHVWDRHGRLIHEDAVRGLPQLDGVHIDRNDNIYVMATPARVLNGTRYFNYMSETLIKFQPGKGKIVAAGKNSPIPLDASEQPKRSMDLSGRWVEGAEWFYGGVGYAGFNTPYAGGGCACWFSRFSMDYFARSFAPEPDRFSVAIVDSAGNLITRVGTYGNVDDGVPLIKDGGPSDPRPLGNDEVSLFHACFTGTHSDRRLFIADLGNARIVSVKLDYRATERVPLPMRPQPNSSNRP